MQETEEDTILKAQDGLGMMKRNMAEGKKRLLL
jgi:hypothetical protein